MKPAAAELRRAGYVGGAVAAGMVLAAWYILSQARLTVDLSYFLPPPESIAEQILVERLGQGPGSKLMFIVLPAGADASPALPALRDALRSSEHFTGLMNDFASGEAQIPDALWRSRLLLADADLTVDGLRAAIRSRLADIALLNDSRMLDLIAGDPAMTAMTVLEAMESPVELAAGGSDRLVWVAETRAPAFDGNAQRAAVDFVTEAVMEQAGGTPELFGAGVYTAELQAAVQSDAQKRSLLATVAIVVVLLFAYRNWRAVILSLTPVVIGGLAGAVFLVALYTQVHGITLAFGFTLLGVAIDYPLHYMSHLPRDGKRQALNTVWPTLRLGALTTACAYFALALGGSDGLAQLGLFSGVAVLAALAATRWVVPELAVLLDADVRPAAVGRRISGRLHNVVWAGVLIVAVAVLAARGGPAWQSDLSALVPVEKSRLVRDAELRAQWGAPDIRYLLAVTAPGREQVLQATERLDPVLAEAKAEGFIEGSTLVTVLLPSRARQTDRVARYPAPADLQARLARAVEGAPLRADIFAPFLQSVAEVTANPDYVDVDTWRDSPLEDLVATGLSERNGKWITESVLYGVSQPDELQRMLDAAGNGAVVDLRAASESLVTEYRERMLLVLAVGALAAAVLLGWRLGSPGRLLWVVGSVTAAIVLTIAVKMIVGGSLSLFGLIACILVAGLSLDYGLFSSRDEADDYAAALTRHAVSVCAASTFIAFVLLAFSPIPVLAEIGSTVALGVAAAWLLMRFGKAA